MTKIIFITGGTRSGKSSFAQKTAMTISKNPVYLATSRIWDEDFKERVKRHQSDRDDRWETIEIEKEISNAKLEGRTVVLDCITLWLTNFFMDNKNDLDKTLYEAKTEWKKFIDQDFNLIVVSNELGMGVHAQNEVGRKFADLQGWMNQFIAKQADEVYLMVSGIPLQIK